MTDQFWRYEKSRKALVIEGHEIPDFLRLSGKAIEFDKASVSALLPWGDVIDEVVLLEAPGLVVVPPAAFAWMPSLEAVDLTSASVIGNSAFYDCPKLKSVIMPKVMVIGSGSFLGCTSLVGTNGGKKLELREARMISSNAFQRCESLETVTFKRQGRRTNEDGRVIQEAGTNLEFLGDYAFLGCKNLSKVYLGGKDAGVTMGSHVFYGCPIAEDDEQQG